MDAFIQFAFEHNWVLPTTIVLVLVLAAIALAWSHPRRNMTLSSAAILPPLGGTVPPKKVQTLDEMVENETLRVQDFNLVLEILAAVKEDEEENGGIGLYNIANDDENTVVAMPGYTRCDLRTYAGRSDLLECVWDNVQKAVKFHLTTPLVSPGGRKCELYKSTQDVLYVSDFAIEAKLIRIYDKYRY